MRARRAARLALLAACWGCQGEERPPFLPDPRPSPEPPPSLVDPAPPSPAPSPCGAASVRLDPLRPKLYFAIDASGSMTAPIPPGERSAPAASAPGTRYDAMARALRALLARVGHRVSYGATLFPGVDGACDAGEEIRALAPGDDVSFALRGELGPALESLIFRVYRRAPFGGTPVALALEALLEPLRERGPDTYLFLVTDGAPNCNAEARCGVDSCIPNLEGLRLSDSVVCDETLNCCAPEIGVENCLDRDGSLAAVQALAAAGVRTFVIGMPGSEAYAGVLDQLALAGGVARPASPHYHRVADAEALLETVSALGLRVALACEIDLAEPPADPRLVNVFFDGEIVPNDPADGWTLDGGARVQLHGAACELLRGGDVLQADVVAGCPVVLR